MPLAEGDHGELEAGWVRQPLHRDNEAGSEHGGVPPLKEVGGERGHPQQAGVSHLPATASTEDRVVIMALTGTLISLRFGTSHKNINKHCHLKQKTLHNRLQISRSWS